MTKTLAVALGCCLSLVACGADSGGGLGSGRGGSDDPPYFGEWSGTDQRGVALGLRFHRRSDGATSLYVTTGSGASETFTYGTCRIDLSQSPASFDIDLDGRATITTILEIVDGQTLEFENINSGVERPREFGPDRVVLKRKR